MIKNIYVDGKKHYFVDVSNGNKYDKYDPDNKNLGIHLELDDSILDADPENIKQTYGGLLIVQYGFDRFVIDDGYQNNLVKAGYIVYKTYDQNHIIDQGEGVKIREKIMNDVRDAFKEYSNKHTESSIMINTNLGNALETEMIINNNDCSITVNADIISGIVIKNKRRKDNSLPFYAFDKSIDKYGSVYMSIFVKKNTKNADDIPPIVKANEINKEILDLLGMDYHFNSQIVKKSVLYYKDL